MTPYVKQDKNAGVNYTLPCGKCPDCAQRRAAQWGFRLMQEERFALSALFVTLTYSTSHVPISDNGFMNLDKTDLQKFFKRLRKNHGHTKKTNANFRAIRYYAVGEYGSHTRRPHYHLILFNASIDLIPAAWGLGECHFGNVSGASVGYTLKYLSKGRTVPMHKNDDRNPEFSLMSKGLGGTYLTKDVISYHKRNPVESNHCTLPGGIRIALPRYYKDRIYSESEKQQISDAARERYADQITRAENDPDYNLHRYEAEQAKLAAFKRQKSKSSKPDKI